MKPKSVIILYWVVTILFCLAMIGDAIGGITQQKQGVEALKHLGYPLYNLRMFGIAKLLGAFAILQPRFTTMKEWAYAGFTFNFLSAFFSRAIVGDPLVLLVPPVVILMIMLLSYYLWKKVSEMEMHDNTNNLV